MSELAGTLPAILPVLLAGVVQSVAIRFNLLPQLARPLDFGIRFRGEPMLGANKTLRGLLIMVIGSALFAWGSSFLLTAGQIPEWLPFLAGQNSAIVFGLLLGLGYSLGELPNSFIKRRLRIAPGARPAGNSRILFYLADQMDSVVGVVLLVGIVYAPPLSWVISLLLVGGVIHILFDRLLYVTGVKGREMVPPAQERNTKEKGQEPGGEGERARPLAIRFLIYLVERFSLLSVLPAFVIHYLFITHYVFGALLFPEWTRWVTSLSTFVGVFLILRLSDDVKDKQHDDRYYSDRPVQRGLISLRELQAILVGTTVLLVIANLLFSTTPALLLFLAALGYLALMRVEFFMPRFLRPRLLLYLVTHQLFIPILVAYVIYNNGGVLATPQDILFVLLNLLVIMAVEVARKIRPTLLDQTGRDTYSAYLGRGGSILFLLAVLAAAQLLFHGIAGVPLWLFALLLAPVLAGVYYMRADSRSSAKVVLNSTVLLLTLNMLAAL